MEQNVNEKKTTPDEEKMNEITHRPELNGTPETGKWYRITPENAVSSDGTPWHGTFYKGTENKVIIYFCGGGVSVNEYTAARAAEFYFPAASKDGWEVVGMPCATEENPFRNWTKLIIPYATGDFHVGQADFPYKKEDGTKGICYHHGYTNSKLLIEQALPLIGKPDTLLLAGFSAGGFGVSMRANEIITKYFSYVPNKTVLVDSAMINSEQWHDIAENVWQAPENITELLKSDNLTLDSLRNLSKQHPDTKILYFSSSRDVDLTRYLGYFETNKLEASGKMGDNFQHQLKDMVNEISSWENTAVFIWDDNMADEEKKLTQHTIIFMPCFYQTKIHGTTTAEWAMNAVNGDLKNYGIEILDKKYLHE